MVDFSDAVVILICDIDDVGRVDPIDGDGMGSTERSAHRVSVLVSLKSASGDRFNGICFDYTYTYIGISERRNSEKRVYPERNPIREFCWNNNQKNKLGSHLD